MTLETRKDSCRREGVLYRQEWLRAEPIHQRISGPGRSCRGSTESILINFFREMETLKTAQELPGLYTVLLNKRALWP